MATAAAIGLLCYFLGETKQRRAFLEAKQSLEVKMVIEEQSAEQVKRKIDVNFFFRESEKSTSTNLNICQMWKINFVKIANP